MVEIAEIVDRKSFRAWLEQEDLPREAMVALAHRAAMRVLPVWWRETQSDDWGNRLSLTALPLLHGILVAQDVLLTGPMRRPQRSLANIEAEISRAQATAVAYAKSNSPPAVAAAESTSLAFRAAKNLDEANYYSARAVETAEKALAKSTNEFWAAVRNDCPSLGDPTNVLDGPLWPEGNNPLSSLWAEVRRVFWSEDNSAYLFWLDWYQRALDGTETRFDLLRDITFLKKDEDGEDLWENPEKLAAEIARLVAEYDDLQPPEKFVEAQLAKMPPPHEASVKQVKAAMERHRRDLPPTFDALDGYLSLEVERLQNRNYRDEEDQKECERQIDVLLTIAETVKRLRALVPKSDEMTVPEAQEAEKLGQLYVKKFKEWPRTNVDEVVDSGWRAALVGATTVALPMIGITAPYAFAAGLVLFGGRKMVDAAKAAKASFP